MIFRAIFARFLHANTYIHTSIHIVVSTCDIALTPRPTSRDLLLCSALSYSCCHKLQLFFSNLIIRSDFYDSQLTGGKWSLKSFTFMPPYTHIYMYICTYMHLREAVQICMRLHVCMWQVPLLPCNNFNQTITLRLQEESQCSAYENRIIYGSGMTAKLKKQGISANQCLFIRLYENVHVQNM